MLDGQRDVFAIFSVIAGALTLTPGRFIPLWLFEHAPVTHGPVDLFPDTEPTTTSSRPSSSRIANRDDVLGELVVGRGYLPALRLSLGSEHHLGVGLERPRMIQRPHRIRGPCKSTRIAMWLPFALRTSRISFIQSARICGVPCELVDPEDVGAGLDQLPEHIGVRAARPYRGNELGAAKAGVVGQFHISTCFPQRMFHTRGKE